MKGPVLILSDLHLGHGASRIDSVPALGPLIAGAGTVLFNGDTLQELSETWLARSRAQLEELKELCAELGAEAVFLPGNHDPGWEGKGWVELAEGRIVVTHGDAVMWGGSPWSRESFARGEQMKELWREHRLAECDAGERLRLAREIARLLKPPAIPKGRSFLRRVMDAVNPPRRALEILRVWAGQADAAAGFAERYFPRAEVVVIGHFHRKGVWTRRGRLVINTGAWLNPHGAMWVEWRDGLLQCGAVTSDFRRGEVSGVWRVG